MSNEVESWLDHELFLFKCTSCGDEPKNLTVGTIRDDQTTLACARCRFENDLTVGRNSIELANVRDSASEKDKQARAAGKIVKRAR